MAAKVEEEERDTHAFFLGLGEGKGRGTKKVEVEHSLAVLGFTGRGREGSLANQKALFSMQEEEEGLSCFPSRQTDHGSDSDPEGRRRQRGPCTKKVSDLIIPHTLSLAHCRSSQTGR